MKQTHIRLFAMLLAGMMLLLCACGTDPQPPQTESSEPTGASGTPEPGTPAGTPAEENIPSQPEDPDDPPEPVNELENLGEPEKSYTCGDASRLNRYPGKSAEDYDRLVAYLKSTGYGVYCESEHNGSRFSTLTMGNRLITLYWLKARNELQMVMSASSGSKLPPQVPAALSGTHSTVVVQMQEASHVNGMGYIIRLADGSFLIYDGGYATSADPIYQKLCELNGGSEGIVIRAWVLTHSHADHYPAFLTFADQHAKHVTLEHLLIAPVAANDAEDTCFNTKLYEYTAKFDGVKVFSVHAGMEFTFCNLKMEILYAPEVLYIDGGVTNFNNSSIVSRVWSDEGSMLFLGDGAKETADFLLETYGSYLQSGMCQVAHHGVEDVPLKFYTTVKASILWYPCTQALYNRNDRNGDVRKALERAAYTKEILIAGNDCYQRDWGYEKTVQ